MKRLVAHFTDSHLGQRLVLGGESTGDKMRYEDAPEEHKGHLRSVLDDIARRGISDAVFGGDIGTKNSVPGFFELISEYALKASIVLGNHDEYSAIAQYCDFGANEIQGKACFSYYDGFLKHVFLDSSSNAVGDGQLAWLAEELRGAVKAILFLHHPVLAIDTPVERAGAALRDRDKLKMVLVQADCEVLAFCGHYHMIDEAREGNIRQFVTPAVSYQIIKQADSLRVDPKTFGYRILEIEGSGIKTEAVLL